MTPDPDPPLPRPPEDPEHLRRLREEALQRVKQEEHATPAPVYGGPPGLGVPPKRRWTRRGLIALIGALVAAAIAWIVGRWMTAPVYGGPPRPVYGGPPPNPNPNPPPDVVPPENPPPTPHRKHKTPPKPPPSATVYGGPPR